MLTLYHDSDVLIEWSEMKNIFDDTYVNDATVTFTVKDTDGVAVDGAEDIAMPYVCDSNGRYAGVLESTVSLTDGASYYVEITATSGSLVGFRRVQVWAGYKGAK